MWHVGNTPTWQVVVHDKRGGDFDGEINKKIHHQQTTKQEPNLPSSLVGGEHKKCGIVGM
jgi:hypothetical protein